MPDRRPPDGEKSAWGQTTSRLLSLLQANGTNATATYNPETIPAETIRRMERHHQLAMALFLIRAPLASTDFGVEGPDETVNAYIKATLRPHFGTIMAAAAETGVTRGCAPFEIVWQRAEGVRLQVGEDEVTRDGYTIAKVKDLDPFSHVSAILVDEHNDFAGYALAGPSTTSDDITLEPERTLHFANDMRYGDWWGRGRLPLAYDQWYRTMLLDDFALQYMERRGTPPPIIEFPPGKDSGDTDHGSAAQSIGAALTEGSDAYVTLPTDTNADGKVEHPWAVKLLDDGQRGDMFLKQLEARMRWMVRPLLIPDKLMTQDGAAGSYALAHTHADIFLQGEEQLGRDIVAAINDQLIPRIVRYNFGDVPLPRVTFPGLRDDVREVSVELFTELAKKDPSVVDMRRMAERLEIPTVEDESAAPEGDDASMSDNERVLKAAQFVLDERGFGV